MKGRNDDPASGVDPVYLSPGLARSCGAGERPGTHPSVIAVEVAGSLPVTSLS